MVEKDYNHPSVILYSTGNEVSETAQERGNPSHGTDDRISAQSGCNKTGNLRDQYLF